MKNSPSKGKKMFIAVISLIITVVFVTVAIFFAIFFSAKLNKDTIIAEKANLKIVDMKGQEVDENSLNKYVKYENISSNIINAFVALEDKRFFEHHGVDYYRLAGAMVKNIKSGYFKEGGSTITQQLAKNTQLNNEKTLTRKIKEMKLAKDIEKEYTKEEILEMYLNAIYYGNGIYGIDSACKAYFDKQPIDINIAEGAILAGIVKNPSAYSPINNPTKATERMRLVCKLMYNQGIITENEYENSINYTYTQPSNNRINPYISLVISEACEKLHIDEKTLLRSGYQIYCFYDEKLQKNVSELAIDEDYKIKTVGNNDCYKNIMICDNRTGGILAAYSPESINQNSFRRSPGSAIKPIAVYAPALEKGIITEASVYVDEITDFNGYCPSNYKNIYIGKTDIETAVKNSINTIAVKVFQQTGMEYCINSAISCGINVDIHDNNLSFALGGMTYGVTDKELCQSYMCFANGGKVKSVETISFIKDKNNKILYQKSNTTKTVFSEETAYIMTDLLKKTAQSGTAKKLSALNIDIASKTGTVGGTKENTDAWCVSYTPDYTVCVWYGGADNTESENIKTTGGGMPTLLSVALYRLLDTKSKFSQPDDVYEANIDLYALSLTDEVYLANENTPKEYQKSYVFDIKNKPEYSPYFLTENTNFKAEFTDKGIVLSYNSQPMYHYEITRKEMFSGNIATILPKTTPNYTLQTVTDDNNCEKNKFYLYELKIVFEGKTIDTKTVAILT